jgi:DNA-binding response OmpR family regulator
MNLESLIISRDAALLGVLRSVLEKIDVDVQACPDPQNAPDLLTRKKFDAIVVDCDDLPAGGDLLKSIRTSQSNAKSVSFAVLNGTTSTQAAFQLGANFVLQKPLTPLNATRCFNAALNFMVRERRRYFRHPVEMPVRIAVPNCPDLTATTTNISEGGMAVRCLAKLSKDAGVTVRFTLPYSSTALELKSEVAWTDGTGSIGLRFVDVPQSSQYQLDKWLTQRMQNELPKRLHECVSTQ